MRGLGSEGYEDVHCPAAGNSTSVFLWGGSIFPLALAHVHWAGGLTSL